MKDTPILKKKYQAIEHFTRRLLTNEVGDSIAKIVLFGSVLRGYASEESDIDLLIIALDAPEKVKKVTSEASFDTFWSSAREWSLSSTALTIGGSLLRICFTE